MNTKRGLNQDDNAMALKLCASVGSGLRDDSAGGLDTSMSVVVVGIGVAEGWSFESVDMVSHGGCRYVPGSGQGGVVCSMFSRRDA
jgi:hypothetical protein